jgi:hypothetical protein
MSREPYAEKKESGWLPILAGASRFLALLFSIQGNGRPRNDYTVSLPMAE